MKSLLHWLIGVAMILIGLVIGYASGNELVFFIFMMVGLLIIDSRKSKKEQIASAEPKKKKHILMWIVAIVIGIFALPVLAPVAIVVLVAALVIWMIGASVGSTKRETDQYLQNRRMEIAADREMWERNKQEDQRRMAMRNEAEKLENQARFWEYQAAKTGRRDDARKAQDYWNKANETRKKI